jgi:hypothetical protein
MAFLGPARLAQELAREPQEVAQALVLAQAWQPAEPAQQALVLGLQ